MATIHGTSLAMPHLAPPISAMAPSANSALRRFPFPRPQSLRAPSPRQGPPPPIPPIAAFQVAAPPSYPAAFSAAAVPTDGHDDDEDPPEAGCDPEAAVPAATAAAAAEAEVKTSYAQLPVPRLPSTARAPPPQVFPPARSRRRSRRPDGQLLACFSRLLLSARMIARKFLLDLCKRAVE